ncbi:hypothetical protein BDR26DRAFT_1017325 [Obelidium mucronatum]|nr:hypothetical protein BDR26DRAFT_1017325 [Obelidium mucronatum]
MSLVTKEVATMRSHLWDLHILVSCVLKQRGLQVPPGSKIQRSGSTSVVVDEEDAEPPVVWPALFPTGSKRGDPSGAWGGNCFHVQHEKHGTRMWHSGERRFVEAAQLAAEADTRKRESR